MKIQWTIIFLLLLAAAGCRQNSSKSNQDINQTDLQTDTTNQDTVQDLIKEILSSDKSEHPDLKPEQRDLISESKETTNIDSSDTGTIDLSDPQKQLDSIRNIKDLDRQTLFRFPLFSDNKGMSPLDSTPCQHLYDWGRDLKYPFYLGLGDHLKYKWKNTFLQFLKDNPDFANNFYPTLADGEDQFYSKKHYQGDWCAGKPLLNLIGLPNRANVHMHKHTCEYYATFPIEPTGGTLYIISAHFPDTPADKPDKAFPEESRKWIIDTVKSIDKGKNDIIMVFAHSINGHFNQYFTKKQKKVMDGKVDFLIAATTHIYAHYTDKDFSENGPLILNSGQVIGPLILGGYLEFSVLKPGDRVFVQYVGTNNDTRILASKDRRFLKMISGKTYAPTNKD